MLLSLTSEAFRETQGDLMSESSEASVSCPTCLNVPPPGLFPEVSYMVSALCPQSLEPPSVLLYCAQEVHVYGGDAK